MKICGITTLPGTAKSFMLPNLQYMAQNGHKCFIISNEDKETNWGDVFFSPLRIKWGKVSILEAIKTIYALYLVFRKEKFDTVQYATTNAALYASVAAWMARVPVRIYCQWGISYFERKGLDRLIYETAERITCKCSNHIQPDSFSNLRFSFSEKLYSPQKGSVVYNGSASGVDLNRFNIKNKAQWRQEIVDSLKLSDYSIVLGYVGRIVRDKGINELLSAFLSINRNDIALVMVGPVERSQLDDNILSDAYSRSNIKWTGAVPDTERYFSAFSYYVLPSYHEGFGMAVLEAAAMGVPSIISNIKGPTDLITHNVNGFICDVKSVQSLKETIELAISLPRESYISLSENAFNKAKAEYSAEEFRKEFCHNRELLLKQHKKLV